MQRKENKSHLLKKADHCCGLIAKAICENSHSKRKTPNKGLQAKI